MSTTEDQQQAPASHGPPAEPPKLDFKDFAKQKLGRDLSIIETSSPVAESFRSNSQRESDGKGSPTKDQTAEVFSTSLRREELRMSVDAFAEAAQGPLLKRLEVMERLLAEKDAEIARLKRRIEVLEAGSEGGAVLLE